MTIVCIIVIYNIMDQKYKLFCTGCGLCQSIGQCTLEEDEKGFFHPKDGNNAWFSKVCPASGCQMEHMDEKEIWGKYEEVYLGYSNNKNVQKKASSGGVISEIAAFLLKTGKVDEIIHVGADPIDPTRTKIYYSKTEDEILSRSGSRYAISSPLMEISLLEVGKKYAFIGKPCDVTALRNYMHINPKLQDQIPYLLSFFCMGLPSMQAQKNLLNALGCTHDNCESLVYRGNGWPGYTTAIDKNGKEYRMEYEVSWGKYLGRDVMYACKFCADGLGEMSDISCGDAWYLQEDGTPDFSEKEGRNVIFARTVKGKELLNEIEKEGCIKCTTYNQFKTELALIQKSQLQRRQEIRMRILAMKVLGKSTPSYESGKLRAYSQGLSLKRKLRVFAGTIKRILKKEKKI